MAHQHQWNDFNIVSTFTLQYHKVQTCDCGLFRVMPRGSEQWEEMQP